MGYSNALEYLETKLKDERTVITERLVQGTLDLPEYKRLCGAIQGLDLAVGYIKDLAKRMEEE
jgi:hypothetical protein